MSADDFDGIRLTKSKLSYIAAALAVGLVAYGAIGDYNRRGYEIERLTERDAARSSELARIAAKLESQNRELSNEITDLKIAINRLADQLERANGK